LVNPASDSDFEEGVDEKQHHEAKPIRRQNILFITEAVHTVLNRSSVHSSSDRPNPRRHVNCIH